MSVRATIVLAAAGYRHRRFLAPLVDEELARCWQITADIYDPVLRALARSKLSEEGANARAAAMLAAQAPPAHRATAARTIALCEVLFDYLDGRSEPTPAGDPLEARRGSLAVFTDAVCRDPVTLDDADSVYLQALAARISRGLAQLPSLGLVAAGMRAAAVRASEAQARIHARSELGAGQLAQWAAPRARALEMDWREYVAGASASVLSVHALIARASYPCRRGGDPAALDAAYLQLATLAKLLDDLVDGDSDSRLYDGSHELGTAVLAAAARSRALMRALRPRHLAVDAGLIAHYARAPGAQREPAASVLQRLAQRNRGTVTLARLALGAPLASQTLSVHPTSTPARTPDDVVTT